MTKTLTSEMKKNTAIQLKHMHIRSKEVESDFLIKVSLTH